MHHKEPLFRPFHGGQCVCPPPGDWSEALGASASCRAGTSMGIRPLVPLTPHPPLHRLQNSQPGEQMRGHRSAHFPTNEMTRRTWLSHHQGHHPESFIILSMDGNTDSAYTMMPALTLQAPAGDISKHCNYTPSIPLLSLYHSFCVLFLLSGSSEFLQLPPI